jgi:MFS superfamily sulfate permease-like transporter
MVGGFLGSLPVTLVIVRSSVNVASGVETRMASFIHGLFLVVTVIFIPNVLNMIPLSSLAAILIITGFKLASPKLFAEMFRAGALHLIPFLTTLITIVLTDLLVGIVAGFVVALIL